MSDVGILLGRRLDASRTPVIVPMSRFRAAGFVVGRTGTGKSSMTLATMISLLTRSKATTVVVDPKGETADLLLDVILPSLGPAAGEIVNDLVVVRPFSRTRITPMNPLAPIDGLERPAQANIVAASLAELFAGGFGPRMAALASRLIECAMEAKGSLLDVVEMLRSDAYGCALAKRLTDADSVRFLVDDLLLESDATRGALLARLAWLLSASSLRASLCARDGLDGNELLRRRLCVIDLSGAPTGSAAATDAIAVLLVQRLVEGIFARPVDPTSRPAFIFIDEASSVLRGPFVVEAERVLSQSRSRGVALILAAQSPAQIAAASPLLLRSIETNIGWKFAFATSREDATQVAASLPMTRAMRSADGDGVLTEAQEREHWARLIASLPPRVMVTADRVRGGCELLTTPSIPFAQARRRAAAAGEDLRQRARHGVSSIPVTDAIRAVRLVGEQDASPPTERRATRPRTKLVLP